jgi:hypothetical protein
MENLRYLWAEAGLRSIDAKITAVERTFDNFEDFWNTTTSSAGFISVLKDLDVTTLDDLKNSTQEILAVNADDPVICNGFANCIKGVV